MLHLQYLKFIYSEKATKFFEIFSLLLTICTLVKNKGKISQIFVAFSEYMNFNLLSGPMTKFFLNNFQMEFLIMIHCEGCGANVRGRCCGGCGYLHALTCDDFGISGYSSSKLISCQFPKLQFPIFFMKFLTCQTSSDKKINKI